jgi:uncharacterized protein (TIGR02217 family)
MTAWHETYPVFPPLLTSASAGREWNTDITEAVGREARNAMWSEGRWRISIGGMKIRASEIDAWDSFIDIVQGMASPFLFRLRSNRFAIESQEIGTGNATATTFQLKKTRAYQGQERDETILFPWHNYPPLTYATGSIAQETEFVRVSIDGVEKTLGTHFTVNRDSGVVTFTAAPENGAVITATCKFMVLVRFSQDWNPVQSSNGKSWEVSGGVELISPKGDA